MQRLEWFGAQLVIDDKFVMAMNDQSIEQLKMLVDFWFLGKFYFSQTMRGAIISLEHGWNMVEDRNNCLQIIRMSNVTYCLCGLDEEAGGMQRGPSASE